MGGLSESVKGKFRAKIFFSDTDEWNSKKLRKMIPADVIAKQQEIKDLVAVPYKVL